MRAQAALWTAVGIGITLLFLQGGSLLGPLGAMLNLLTPVAAAYISMRFGLQAGIILVTVVSLLLLQLAPLYTLTAYLGLFGVGSLLLPFFSGNSTRGTGPCCWRFPGRPSPLRQWP